MGEEEASLTQGQVMDDDDDDDKIADDDDDDNASTDEGDRSPYNNPIISDADDNLETEISNNNEGNSMNWVTNEDNVIKEDGPTTTTWIIVALFGVGLTAAFGFIAYHYYGVCSRKNGGVATRRKRNQSSGKELPTAFSNVPPAPPQSSFLQR